MACVPLGCKIFNVPSAEKATLLIGEYQEELNDLQTFQYCVFLWIEILMFEIGYVCNFIATCQ